MQAKKHATPLWQPKYHSNDEFKKLLEALINIVEMNRGTSDDPGLVLCQLVKNGVLASADGDVLGAANPEQIAAATAEVAESTKVAILLDGANG